MSFSFKTNPNFERDLNRAFKKIGDEAEKSLRRQVRIPINTSSDSEPLLEPRQIELLIEIVELVRSIPENRRDRFILVSNHVESYAMHQTVRNARFDVYKGDIDVLANEGLLNIDFGSRGSTLFDVSPRGFRYYEELMQSKSEPSESMQDVVSRHLNFEPVRNRYPEAHRKWSEAQAILAGEEALQHHSTIGHLCREAVQEFAEVVYKRTDAGETFEKAHTVKRICEALKAVESESTGEFLKALVGFQAELNTLVQRLEHSGQKEGESVTTEDARRVVFGTAYMMFEVDRALNV